MHGGNQDVDDLDADERNDDAAEAVDGQVAAKQGRRADGAIGGAFQRERNQRDDDQRVEDDRREDRGLVRMQAHDVERRKFGIGRDEQGGNDREIFRDVVGDRERGQGTARHQQLFADADDLDQLGRIRVEIDHVARFAGGLGAGLHGDADVGLRKSGGVVGAVAAHRDQSAALLFLPDISQLVLGRRLGEEVVDAGFRGDGRGGERIVSRDHHRLDAHRPQLGEARADVGLDDVLQVDDPEQLAVVGDRQRSSPGTRDSIDRLNELGGRGFARQARLRQDRVDGALAQHAAGQIDAGNAGLRGERHDRALRRIRRRDVVAVPGERDDRASLGGLVVEARQQDRLRQLLFRHTRDRDELVGHAVAESDRPRLVEQQRIDVARRLDGAAGRGNDVEADEAVHAGYADRREQAADRGRDQTDEQRDQHRHRKHGSGIAGERPERGADDEEDERQAGQQDRKRQFVRRLLPFGALDERDHAVDERRARG